jgi:4-alpha-glucanotransferase
VSRVPRSREHARLAGVAVPLFSLRSESDGGIGDFETLKTFVEWAAPAGHRVIALLPLGELAAGEASPYNALSSFALDPIYLRPAAIEELRDETVEQAADRGAVDYAGVRARKEPLFQRAFAKFRALAADHPRRARFDEFRARAASWLADYALFRALSEEESGRSWKDWPDDVAKRDASALEAARERLANRISYFEYLQFVADEAWTTVRRAAAARGVVLMGDLPFAPSENSADVWAHPEAFDVSRSVGAPPDAFSETGQQWGLPMFRWQALRRSDWHWLRARARRMAELYDLFRVDHVVGLFRTFNFVGGEPNGFEPSHEAEQIAQGREVLGVLRESAQPAELVAEDLGMIPDFVLEALSELDIPGYKVLRWQRNDDGFIDPAGYPECSIATTGTHDTDSLVEWWRDLTRRERAEVLALAAMPHEKRRALSRETRLALLEYLYRSPSRYVIVPIQDLFGWRSRINTPATTGEENWVFRLPLPIERFAFDRDVAADTAALAASIDASGRLRKIG